MSRVRLLLCTDLDRTLIPNGAQPESPGARQRFAALVAHDDILLAYPPLGSSKLQRLMRLPETASLTVGLDSIEALRGLGVV